MRHILLAVALRSYMLIVYLFISSFYVSFNEAVCSIVFTCNFVDIMVPTKT